MIKLLDNLKSSGPFRVGMVYALTGTALVFTADAVLGALDAPQWIFRLVVAAVFMVFPFVVALTWALAAGPPEGTRVRPRPWELGGS